MDINKIIRLYKYFPKYNEYMEKVLIKGQNYKKNMKENIFIYKTDILHQ